MNIRDALLKEHSRQQIMRIVKFIGDDKKRFDELMQLLFNDIYRVSQRAAWPVNFCAEAHPKLMGPYIKPMIELLNKKVHNAVKRNVVRILQFIVIPEKYFGIAAGACFDLLRSGVEPVAVKVFSMTVLANICKYEPGLSNELRILIEQQLPYASSGFKSRAAKVLKGLNSGKSCEPEAGSGGRNRGRKRVGRKRFPETAD